MRRVGQTRRRDANEKPIRTALEAVGATFTPVSGRGAPDAVIVFRGRVYAVEIKSAKGKRTAAQEHTQWPIVRSVDEALAAIGAAPVSGQANPVQE